MERNTWWGHKEAEEKKWHNKNGVAVYGMREKRVLGIHKMIYCDKPISQIMLFNIL